MSPDRYDFGFSPVRTDPWTRIGSVQVEEYRSSININPFGIPIEKIVEGAAQNLAFRAERFTEQMGWQKVPVSFVLTLTLMPGENRHSEMSLKQE